MPRISDRKPIESQFLKKSAKLIPCQRKMVLYWTKQGLSQRKLAKMFNVSRRTIQFIQDPEKLERNKQTRKNRGGSKAYYDKEYNREQIQKHRLYKKELYNKNLI